MPLFYRRINRNTVPINYEEQTEIVTLSSATTTAIVNYEDGGGFVSQSLMDYEQGFALLGMRSQSNANVTTKDTDVIDEEKILCE